MILLRVILCLAILPSVMSTETDWSQYSQSGSLSYFPGVLCLQLTAEFIVVESPIYKKLSLHSIEGILFPIFYMTLNVNYKKNLFSVDDTRDGYIYFGVDYDRSGDKVNSFFAMEAVCYEINGHNY